MSLSWVNSRFGNAEVERAGFCGYAGHAQIVRGGGHDCQATQQCVRLGKAHTTRGSASDLRDGQESYTRGVGLCFADITRASPNNAAGMFPEVTRASSAYLRRQWCIVQEIGNFPGRYSPLVLYF